MSLNLDDGEVQREILDKLTCLLENQTPLSDRLWTIKDCAIYFRVSELTARRVLAQPGSPRPIRLPTNKDSRLPARYIADEIRTFAARRAKLRGEIA